jgi:heat shock protein HtpX
MNVAKGNGFVSTAKVFGLLAVMTGVFIGAGAIIGGTGGMVIGLGLAGVMNLGSYWFSDKIVLKIYGGQKAEEDSYPELHSSVEKLAQEAGIPKPDLYIADMGVPNAFATGRNPENGVVCVTNSLMDTLDHDEVEGVIAHELAHIKNRDTLTNSVVATLAGAIGMLAEMAFWGSMFGGREEEGDMISGLVLMITVPLIATLIKTAVSRTMEYRADSDAVKISGNGSALSSALRKIDSQASRGMRGRTSRVQQAGSNLFIKNPFSGSNLTRFFSTHPPLEDRIENIESTEKTA